MSKLKAGGDDHTNHQRINHYRITKMPNVPDQQGKHPNKGLIRSFTNAETATEQIVRIPSPITDVGRDNQQFLTRNFSPETLIILLVHAILQ